MPTNVNTGNKIHLKGNIRFLYRKGGKLFIRKKKISGKPKSACNLYDVEPLEEFLDFRYYYKKFPNDVCRNCSTKYKELISDIRDEVQ